MNNRDNDSSNKVWTEELFWCPDCETAATGPGFCCGEQRYSIGTYTITKAKSMTSKAVRNT